jgi:light-regulated signal transduction histidine kinase (bacteriophytochrome)
MIRKNWSERRPLTSFTLKIAKRQRKPSINGFLKKLNQPHLKTGHWYRCSDKAVSWINGKMVRFEIAADITEKKLAEIELRELSEALKRSNQELEQFAYVASHDLQEPLRMISSYTQLLEKRYSDKLDQDAKDFINYAVDGANRMQKLIQDLLTYSRVTTRGLPMEIFDAHDALGEAIWNLNMQIQDANALISNDELPSIKGDKTQLVVVFQNLIGNAIKFKNPDVPPRVHISAQKAEGRLGFCTFSIKDNGIGIEEKYFEKLFVIFQRLHGKREYPGTGIGLALVKRIIERHGGKIWL